MLQHQGPHFLGLLPARAIHSPLGLIAFISLSWCPLQLQSRNVASVHHILKNLLTFHQKHFYFKKMYLYCSWICVGTSVSFCALPASGCLQSSEEGIEFSVTGVAGGCELPCRCWELNPSRLREQQEPLTAEASLWPQTFLLLGTGVITLETSSPHIIWYNHSLFKAKWLVNLITFEKYFFIKQGIVMHTLKPCTWEGKAGRSSEFEASLLNEVNSRTARAIKKNPALKE